jgi:anthranilate synthase component 2
MRPGWTGRVPVASRARKEAYKLMERVLVIDNYDSFVHNLVHYLEHQGAEVDVYRNDRISLEEALRYERVLLSPGPGLPKDAGIMPALLKRLGKEQKLLGVCLGHQALVEAMGGGLKNLERVVHGEATTAFLEGKHPLFEELPEQFEIGHYHSWVLDEASLPGSLEVTVRDQNGDVMGVAHRDLPYSGVQFHPESVLTPTGMQIIRNWLKL